MHRSSAPAITPTERRRRIDRGSDPPRWHSRTNGRSWLDLARSSCEHPEPTATRRRPPPGSGRGPTVETWHVSRLIESPAALDRFQILTIPGGFSYGDDLGAGRILATRLGTVLGDALRRFHDRGGLVLGICNGFQVLVRSGLLPGGPPAARATLARNDSGRFEARWVRLVPRPGLSPFVSSPSAATIELPVAHGEGRFVTAEPRDLDALDRAGQIVLKYADAEGRPTEDYPANPNGSAGAVAGLCDPTGRIFGLMPHPERFIEPWHHPRWTRHRGIGRRIRRRARHLHQCRPRTRSLSVAYRRTREVREGPTTMGLSRSDASARIASTTLIVTPPRPSTATAFPPGWPSRSPSISRPPLSCSPDGG